MANEGTKVEGPYEAHDYTIGSTSGIAQYALCIFGDPRTAQASTAADSGVAFAGLAGTEKVAASNATELGMITKGTFLLTNAPTAIAAGTLVTISGVNLIRAAVDADHIAGAIIGKTLQAFAAGGEQGEVKVGEVV